MKYFKTYESFIFPGKNYSTKLVPVNGVSGTEDLEIKLYLSTFTDGKLVHFLTDNKTEIPIELNNKGESIDLAPTVLRMMDINSSELAYRENAFGIQVLVGDVLKDSSRLYFTTTNKERIFGFAKYLGKSDRHLYDIFEYPKIFALIGFTNAYFTYADTYSSAAETKKLILELNNGLRFGTTEDYWYYLVLHRVYHYSQNLFNGITEIIPFLKNLKFINKDIVTFTDNDKIEDVVKSILKVYDGDKRIDIENTLGPTKGILLKKIVEECYISSIERDPSAYKNLKQYLSPESIKNLKSVRRLDKSGLI